MWRVERLLWPVEVLRRVEILWHVRMRRLTAENCGMLKYHGVSMACQGTMVCVRVLCRVEILWLTSKYCDVSKYYGMYFLVILAVVDATLNDDFAVITEA